MNAELGKPAVTVVMAAYHRPEVMGFAIRSVLDQTLSAWELLVVGDHCTDSTEDVVRSFRDSRIRFYNLPQNAGDQSGPNNVGCEQARGGYVAFLNQDDLWLPDHLETSSEALRTTTADLVFTVNLQAFSPEFRVFAAPPASRLYEPQGFYPASTWVFRRELWGRVGPWKHHTECLAAPSQEWLFRAWRRGARLASLPWADVVTPFSGTRTGSYVNRVAAEHEGLYHRIRNEPDFMRREAIRSVGCSLGAARGGSDLMPVFARPPSLVVRVAARALGLMGIHSHAVSNLLRFGGRGGFVRGLRRHRGLDPRPASRDAVSR